ncbi:MipA/OmpV family protein [Aquabacterium sp.]|uniref:MipA/OmpV family protein n=1 Tax=Aquabacterium sp. TaxID=1872578 RepID=UPI002CE9BB72|nr:MipA/OmpV family protein [Aquabacterium sp.]HSW07517.1 MipA/OmpV family protein [Aquabacterium sp.]
MTLCPSLLRTSLALALLLATAGAQAAEDKPLWELGVGAGVLQLPHYRGSDQSHTWLLPVPYIVYRGDIFKADRNGARALLVDVDRFSVDVSVSASTPTRSRDNVAREGMPDLKPTIEIGPNLNWTLGRGADWKLELRLPVRAAVTVASQPRVAGWITTPNLNLDLRSGPWNIGVLGGPVFGNRKLHGFFYDVAPAYATAARPAYQASGGYAGSTLAAALSQREGARWIGAFVKYDRLSGAAFEDSPLVRQRQQWSFGIAVSWVLAASEQRVSVNE